MLETVIGVFISVFFIFGLYCAACETGRLVLRILRHKRHKRHGGTIDRQDKKGYNNIE